jgi:hypothetical protein
MTAGALRQTGFQTASHAPVRRPAQAAPVVADDDGGRFFIFIPPAHAFDKTPFAARVKGVAAFALHAGRQHLQRVDHGLVEFVSLCAGRNGGSWR